MMKRYLCRGLRLLKLLLLGCLGAGLAADLYCELVGLPPAGIEIVRACLAQRGVLADICGVRGGLLWGVYARGLTLWDARLPGYRLIEADQVHLRPDLWALVHGDVACRAILVRDGRARLPSPNVRCPSRGPPLLELTDLAVDARLADGVLDLQRVQGEVEGVSLRAIGMVSDRKPLLLPPGPWRRPRPAATRTAELRSTPPPWQLSALPYLESIEPAHEEQVRRLWAFLRARAFAGNAGIDVRLSLFAQQPWQNAVSGAFSLPDFGLGETRLRECGGRFVIADNVVRFNDIHVRADGLGLVEGESTLRCRLGLIEGDLRGRLQLLPALALLGCRLPAPLDSLSADEPATFAVRLAPAPLDPARWQADFSCEVQDLRVRRLPVRRLHLRGSWKKDQLRVDEFELLSDSAGTVERLAGRFELSLPSQRLSGSVEGTCLLFEHLRQLDLPVDRYVQGLAAPGPAVRLDLLLDDSPSAPAQWTGRGSFSVPSFRFRNLELRKVSGQIEVSPGLMDLVHVEARGGADAREYVAGELHFDWTRREVAAELQGAIYPATLVAASRDFPAAVQPVLAGLSFGGGVPTFEWTLRPSPLAVEGWRGELTVAAADVRYRALEVPTASCRVAFAPGTIELRPELFLSRDRQEQLGGHIALDLRRRRLQGQIEGRVYLDRAYAALGLPAVKPFSCIKLEGAPAEAKLVVEDSPWSPDAWNGTAVFKVDRGRYETLPVTRFEAGLDFAPDAVKLHVQQATAWTDTEVTCELEVDLPAAANFRLSGHVRGDPLFAAVFVPPGEPRQIYEAIWRDVTWTPGKRPEIRVDRLHVYVDPDPRSPDWFVTLDGSIGVEGPSWRGTQLEQFQADVDLNLPPEITVSKVMVRRGDSALSGNVRVDLSGNPSCSFDCSGHWNPWEALRAIDPAWATPLEVYRLDDRTWVTCTGTVPFGERAADCRLAGAIETDACQVARVQLQDVGVNWQLRDRKVSLDRLKASYCGGTVQMSGEWDLASGSVQGRAEVEGVDLYTCASSLGSAFPHREMGTLAGNCEFGQAWFTPEGQLRLEGTGRASVRRGDLWQVPLFRELGAFLSDSAFARLTKLSQLVKLTGLGDLGQITDLDAELEFASDHVTLSSFSTNGTILALRGRGEYRWDTEEIDMFVRGVLLEKTVLLPLVLTPVTWLFVEGARCTGTRKEHQWRAVSPLERVLPGSEERSTPKENRRGDR